MKELLDKFFATTRLFTFTYTFFVKHLPVYKAYHAPIFLKKDHTLHEEGGNKHFKFMSISLSNDECKRVVEEIWNG